MAGYYFDVLETVANPGWVFEGDYDELWAVKLISKRKAMLVIYKESRAQNDGFIITAFFTTKVRKLLARRILLAAIAAVKEIFEAVPHIRKIGAKHLWFDFDYEADVLYVSLDRPQRATDTDILEDGVFLRLRDEKIVGMTITDVSKKFKG